MPLFFFNIRTKTDLIKDLEGQEFASLDTARAEAILAAREIMGGRVKAGEDPDGSQFEITDCDQRVVLVVPFLNALVLHSDK